MPLPTYRVRLADGAIVFVDDLAYAKRTYPDATILNRLVDDGMGNAISHPYQGKQPQEVAAEEAQKAEEAARLDAEGRQDARTKRRGGSPPEGDGPPEKSD